MIARVVRTRGGKLLDDIPFDTVVVEGAIRDRDEKYGVDVHGFAPTPGRDYWLITWPLELDPKRAATELLMFTLGILPSEGEIVLPTPWEHEVDHGVGDVLNQDIVFSKRLQADGTTTVDEVRSIGHRFVVA